MPVCIVGTVDGIRNRHHTGTCGECNRSRLVSGAVVHDDQLVDETDALHELPVHGGDDLAQGRLLVASWDADRDTAVCLDREQLGGAESLMAIRGDRHLEVGDSCHGRVPRYAPRHGSYATGDG